MDSPFLARAESPGRARAGAWRLLHSYRLTWALGGGVVGASQAVKGEVKGEGVDIVP